MRMKTKTCNNCGAEAQATQQGGNFIDGGLSIHLPSMGHYGGFWDDYTDSERNFVSHICHDCSVLFMRTFPGLAKLILPHGGGHPNNCHLSDKGAEGTYEPSCCEFAWTWDTEERTEEGTWQTYFGTTDGSWEKVFRLGKKLVRESFKLRQGVL
jgi:hypothetical protein